MFGSSSACLFGNQDEKKVSREERILAIIDFIGEQAPRLQEWEKEKKIDSSHPASKELLDNIYLIAAAHSMPNDEETEAVIIRFFSHLLSGFASELFNQTGRPGDDDAQAKVLGLIKKLGLVYMDNEQGVEEANQAYLELGEQNGHRFS